MAQLTLNEFYQRLAWQTLKLRTMIAAKRFKTTARPSLGIVLVAWDKGATKACIMALRKYSARFPQTSFVVVENRPDVVTDAQRGEVKVLQGSNRAGEFSALDEGIAWVKENAAQRPNVWLLANDRALSYDRDYVRKLLEAHLVAFVSTTDVAVAFMDILPNGVAAEVDHLSTNSYARTNAMLFSDSAVESLGSLTLIDKARLDAAMPTEFPGSAWTLGESGLVSGEYARFLDSWLTGKPPIEGIRWFRAEPLSAEFWPKYRIKVQAILNEHALAGRLRANSIALLPERVAELVALRAHSGPVGDSIVSAADKYPDASVVLMRDPFALLRLFSGDISTALADELAAIDN